MFQATPGVLTSRFLRMWSEASRKPSGTVVASDVFAAGLIASDTDHRIFRDFGDVPGIDFAWVENTQAYHTPRDTLALVRPGTIQASGDNLLGFVQALHAGSAPDDGPPRRRRVQAACTGTVR